MRLDPLFLLLCLLLAFWQLPLGSDMLKWDATDIYLPWKFFITECLAQGELPFWNPSLMGGFAQMGDPGTWYPLSWLIGLCMRYDLNALHIEFFVHLYLASLGFYALSRQQNFGRSACLMLAVIYPLSGFFIGNAQHVGWLVSAAWLPWVFLFFNKLAAHPNSKDALRLSAVSFLMFSGGYPGIFVVLFYLLLGFFGLYFYQFIKNKNYNTLKNWLLQLSLAALFFLGCAASLLVALADLLPHITRSQGLSQTAMLAGALPPQAVLSFLFPFAASINQSDFWQSDFSMVNCYIGILPFILLIFNALHPKSTKSSRFYFGVGVLFLMIAMAGVFPFRTWLSALPAMDGFRFPALFRLYALFFFLLAIGKNWAAIWTNPLLLRQLALAFLVAALGIGIYSFWQCPAALFSPVSIAERAAVQGFIQCFFLLGAASLLYFSRFATIQKKGFLFLVISDMLLATQLNLPATVLAHTPPPDFSTLLDAYPIPSLQTPLDAQKDQHLKNTLPPLWRSLAIFHKQPAADGFNPYVFSTAEPLMDNGTYAAFANRCPLFFLSADNQPDSLHILADSLYHIQIQSYSPNAVALHLNSEQSAYLVFAQNYYPHWQAELDGAPVSVVKFYKTFLAIKVPAGKHSITWGFRPNAVLYAFWVSLAFWLLLLFLLGWLWADKKGQRGIFLLTLFLLGIAISWRLQARRSPSQINTEIEKWSSRAENKTALKITDKAIHNPLDIGRLADTLAQAPQPYLWFCHACRPFFPETEWALKHYYPIHLKTEKNGAGFCWLLSKNTVNIGIRNDFENPTPAAWTWEKPSIDSSSSGNHFQRLDAAYAFSANHKAAFRDYLRLGDTLSIQLKIKMKTGAAPLLVLQANDLWKDYALSDYIRPESQWTSVFWRIPLSDLPLQAQDSLAFFIWNKGSEAVEIDEIEAVGY